MEEPGVAVSKRWAPAAQGCVRAGKEIALLQVSSCAALGLGHGQGTLIFLLDSSGQSL